MQLTHARTTEKSFGFTVDLFRALASNDGSFSHILSGYSSKCTNLASESITTVTQW
jgi:hypothetical protein